MEALDILLVEDDPYDAELVQSFVRRSGIEASWTRVDSESAFLAALEKPHDVLITDFKLPSFNALRVLEILEEREVDLPALVVTGAIDDELAADCIKRGAMDYLLKDRLARLGDAILGAIARHRAHREKRQAEEKLLAEAKARVILYSMLSRSVSRAAPAVDIEPADVLAPLLEPEAVPDLLGIRYERAGRALFEGWKPGRRIEALELRRVLESPAEELGSLVFCFSPDSRPLLETELLLDQAAAVFLDYLVRTEAERNLLGSISEKNELLREIHHRVKNNLAAVAGLISLEAGRASGDSAQDVLVDLEGRIRSMALVHEMLYARGGFTGIDFEEYALELADRVGQSVGAAAGTFAPAVECAGLRVPLETAVTLGIVVSELYSRSAMRAMGGKRVSAGLRAWKSEGGGGGWNMEYREDADPESPPPSKNLDLAWVIVKQLGGAVREDRTSLSVAVELKPGEVGDVATVPETTPAEEELRLESGILGQVLRSSPAGILVYDSSANCIIANEAAATIAGETVEALLAQNYRRLETWREGGLIHAADEALSSRTRVRREFHSLSSSGKEVEADYRFSAFDYRGGLYLLVVVLDVSERLRAEAAKTTMEDRLALSALNAKAADRELESFFYGVTHDLRAPLRAIGGFIAILAEDEGERLSADGKRLVGTIQGNVARMERLIEELLAFARLSRTEVEVAAIDMGALARTVYEKSVAEDDRGRIEFTVGDMPSARADPRLLKQVWSSLISNAIKFSSKRERAHIAVDGLRDGRELVYSIRDDGVGFDMKYYGKLFGVFQRLHSVRDFEGSGMGLAFVQRAIIKQGGRIWAEGKVGGGAVFSFALPAPEE
jgi:PAS domain S-box-containing protein